jgi:hypothetical protein
MDVILPLFTIKRVSTCNKRLFKMIIYFKVVSFVIVLTRTMSLQNIFPSVKIGHYFHINTCSFFFVVYLHMHLQSVRNLWVFEKWNTFHFSKCPWLFSTGLPHM